jgi:hypothetical protein
MTQKNRTSYMNDPLSKVQTVHFIIMKFCYFFKEQIVLILWQSSAAFKGLKFPLYLPAIFEGITIKSPRSDR